jgi:hypothetical protein
MFAIEESSWSGLNLITRSKREFELDPGKEGEGGEEVCGGSGFYR